MLQNAAGSAARLSTGIEALDQHLGGGLLPGTLTVVVGATGIGKTQLGLQFAQAGVDQEGRPGVVFDMTARVDSQNHAQYAERMFGRKLVAADASADVPLDGFFDPQRRHGDYLQIFAQQGRRVTRGDMDFDAWHAWQAEQQAKLTATIAFFYGNFISGVRRAVIDGIEPVDRASDSIQFELFEYVYHQILRKESEWVARDLLRQKYRAHAELATTHRYDHQQIAALLLYTSHETMLEDLIRRPIEQGDLLSGANTIIYMGKMISGAKLTRGLVVAKHRGSACSDDIIPYRIDERGIVIG